MVITEGSFQRAFYVRGGAFGQLSRVEIAPIGAKSGPVRGAAHEPSGETLAGGERDRVEHVERSTGQETFQAARFGIEKRKVAPRPATDSTATEPPCISSEACARGRASSKPCGYGIPCDAKLASGASRGSVSAR
jgi:hypothetical protein